MTFSLPQREFLVPLLLLCWAALALAEENKPLILDLDYEKIEPEVEVKEFDNRRVEEYRVNSNLYAIKVKPKNGKSYYLIDPEGTGQMEWRRDAPESISIPNWSLKSW